MSSSPASSSRSTTPSPSMAAHALAIGLREFVPVDDGIAKAMRSATEAGAAIVAAHPNGDEPAFLRGRLTKRFSRDAGLRGLAHRFELFNRAQLFGWVAEGGPARRRLRRLPLSGPSPRLEDPPAQPARRVRGRRVPALAAPGLPHAARRRAGTRRRLRTRAASLPLREYGRCQEPAVELVHGPGGAPARARADLPSLVAVRRPLGRRAGARVVRGDGRRRRSGGARPRP